MLFTTYLYLWPIWFWVMQDMQSYFFQIPTLKPINQYATFNLQIRSGFVQICRKSQTVPDIKSVRLDNNESLQV